MTETSPLKPEIRLENGALLTDSRIISRHFSKRHTDILKAIKKLDCTPEFSRRNFASANYLDAQGKQRPYFTISRDGFTFLVMGFRGKKAAQWKEAYIEAFNTMTEQLCALPSPAPMDSQDCLQDLEHGFMVWKPPELWRGYGDRSLPYEPIHLLNACQ